MFSSKSLHNNFWILPSKLNVFISSLLLNKQSTGGCLLYKETKLLEPMILNIQGLEASSGNSSDVSDIRGVGHLLPGKRQSIGEQRCACVSCSSFSVRVRHGMLPAWQYLLLIPSWSFKHIIQIKFLLYILQRKYYFNLWNMWLINFLCFKSFLCQAVY